jgi:dolichol-phosphate mannosyltransferase
MMVFVDDGSGDASWDICKEIADIDENVRLLKLSRNFGAHAACYAGLVVCTGDCAITKSADCQEPSSLILDMYESWKQGNNVVLAARIGKDERFPKVAFSNMYFWVVRSFISKKMPKMGFDCFLLDRRAIDALKLLDERHSAMALQVLWVGFKTSVIPYIRLARRKGKSMWTLSKKMKMVVDSIVAFSPAPVRFVECLGALFAAVAAIWGLWLIIARLLGHIEVEGWTALMVTVLFSSGLIMLSLGILGEYIWRTFDVAQNRPVYIVEDEVNPEESRDNAPFGGDVL